MKIQKFIITLTYNIDSEKNEISSLDITTAPFIHEEYGKRKEMIINLIRDLIDNYDNKENNSKLD